MPYDDDDYDMFYDFDDPYWEEDDEEPLYDDTYPDYWDEEDFE